MSIVQKKVNEFLQAFKARGLCIAADTAEGNDRSLLIAPARDIKAGGVNEMLSLSGSHLFVALSPERIQAFRLSRMSEPRRFFAPTDAREDNLCVSVEAREGVSSGISAADRACTIGILGENKPDPAKLVSPGHIFPLAARRGGVLVKSSLREAALDIVRIAGYTDAAVLVDLLDEQGEFLSTERQVSLAKQRKIPMIRLSDLIRYRLETEKLVSRVTETRLPTTDAGPMISYAYKSSIHSGEHLALVKGEIDPEKPVLTRVQPEFTFADVFGGKPGAGRELIHRCLRIIGENGSGVFLYLRQPEQGQLRRQIELGRTKVNPQSSAAMREYGLGAQILRDLGVRKIELLTNSQNKLIGLNSFGIEITSTRSI